MQGRRQRHNGTMSPLWSHTYDLTEVSLYVLDSDHRILGDTESLQLLCLPTSIQSPPPSLISMPPPTLYFQICQPSGPFPYLID